MRNAALQDGVGGRRGSRHVVAEELVDQRRDAAADQEGNDQDRAEAGLGSPHRSSLPCHWFPDHEPAHEMRRAGVRAIVDREP
jgi:hypothetical protein